MSVRSSDIAAGLIGGVMVLDRGNWPSRWPTEGPAEDLRRKAQGGGRR